MVFRKSKKTFRAKKWYFKGGVKAPGGFGGNVEFGTRKAKAFVKKVMHQEAEPKHKLIVNQNGSMLHNSIYTMNILGNIPQGTTEYTRIGDIISLEAVKIKGIAYRNVANSGPQFLRFMLIQHKTEYQGASDTLSTGFFATTDIFKTTTFISGGPGPLAAMVDRKQVTVLWDYTYKLPTAQITSQNQYALINKTLSLKRKIDYKPGTNFEKNKNLYLLCFPFVDAGTAGVTTACTLILNYDIIFKDL